MRRPRHFIFTLSTSVVLVCGNISRVGALQSPTGSAQGNDSSRICLEAAKEALGPTASVLRCGHLTGGEALEVAAGTKLTQFKETKDGGIAVSKLVVLRRNGSQWFTEFTADKNWMRNNVGYIGLEFIDDSFRIFGYRVFFLDRRFDDAAGFTIRLEYMIPNGETDEGIPTEISWNPSVKRFQEFAYGEDPEGFRPEIVNPPHRQPRTHR